MNPVFALISEKPRQYLSLFFVISLVANLHLLQLEKYCCVQTTIRWQSLYNKSSPCFRRAKDHSLSTIPAVTGRSSLLKPEEIFRFAMKNSASIYPFCPFQKLNILVIHFHKIRMLYLTVRRAVAALLQ